MFWIACTKLEFWTWFRVTIILFIVAAPCKTMYPCFTCYWPLCQTDIPGMYIVLDPILDRSVTARHRSVPHLVCLTIPVSWCHPNILGILVWWSISQVYLNSNIWTWIINPLKLNGYKKTFLWNVILFICIFLWESMFKYVFKNESYILNIRHPYLLTMCRNDIYE